MSTSFNKFEVRGPGALKFLNYLCANDIDQPVGSVIYTQNGYYARQFAKETDGGMVGVNVGIPVPLGIFGFTGHKESFFGDLHVMGKDGFAFFTESKVVTQTWFPEDGEVDVKVDTWDGTITSMPDKK